MLLRSDNMTVVSYINTEGGTESLSLCMLTWKVLQWCNLRNIRIRAVHIAGVDNQSADLFSRMRVLPAEGALHRAMVLQMFSLYGTPNIVLFISRENTHRPVYCSWRMEQEVWAIDALSVPWDRLDRYAYLPLALNNRVINKVKAHKCLVIIVAPVWPRRQWYSRILEMLQDRPRKFSERTYCPKTEERLLILDSEVKDFLKQQPSSWHL